MLVPISLPPTTITLDQHSDLTSSTPASWDDIPPVLRWGPEPGQDEEVEVEMEPGWKGFGEGNEGEKMKGKLWVTEKSITFLPTSSSSSSSANSQPKGFEILYPSLTLHAISPASSSSSSAFLYCQIDDPSADPDYSNSTAGKDGERNGTKNGDGSGHGINGDVEENKVEDDEEDNNEEIDEDTPMRELRVYVSTPERLTSLFNSLSHCSSLYPSLYPDPSSSTSNPFGQSSTDQPRALAFDPETLFAGIEVPEWATDEMGVGGEGEFEDAEEDGEGEGMGVEGKDGVEGKSESESAGAGVGRVRSDFQVADPRFKPY